VFIPFLRIDKAIYFLLIENLNIYCCNSLHVIQLITTNLKLHLIYLVSSLMRGKLFLTMNNLTIIFFSN
jgi:hypothetical protein